MCIVIVTHNSCGADLLLLANREEFFLRDAEPLHAWKDGDVYAGRDKLLGGTWLAVNRYGEFAALTNASAAVPDARKQQDAEGEPASRGGVPLAIVDGSRALETNLNRLGDSQFRPYFALAGDAATCFYTHNIAGAHVEAVDTSKPQVLSNRPLAHSERQDSALALLEHLERQASPLIIEDLARTLDGHQPTERSVHLPLRANGFGTRCSTAVRIRGDICEICEISYNSAGEETHSSHVRFVLDSR